MPTVCSTGPALFASVVPASPPAAAAPQPQSGRGRSYRVLVVDDMPSIHQDMRKVLTAEKGESAVSRFEESLFGTPQAAASAEVTFVIDSAFQTSEAIRRVREATLSGEHYAVAFVDMRMPPGEDGLQAIVGMWRIDPRIQIVICSAYADYNWEEISTATGGTDQLVILRKPFENIELRQLAYALAKKWELDRAGRQHVQSLEALVQERTRELGEKQAIFQLILENAADLIAVVDAQGKRIYNSPSYRTVLGYEPSELQESDAFVQIHPDDEHVVNDAVAAAGVTGHGELVTYRMRHRDGSWRTLESRAGVVKGEDGQLAYFVIVARDVTRRREMELKDQLGQKLESIGRLAAGIAHEINTPTQFITDNTRFLTTAFGHCSGLMRQYRAWREDVSTAPGIAAAPPVQALAAAEVEIELDYLLEEIPRALEQNLQGLGRVARIVKSLKEFTHPNTPELAPADINAALTTAIAVCRHEWKYVAEVITDFDASLPLVPCILDEFNQVILNLLVNAAHTVGDAVKARGETLGTIKVVTRVEGKNAIVEVTDSGMGIPVELRERIFEPFFTTKEVGRGTGQGLSIVHAVIVKHHGGTVDFTSETGRGTTFRLRLPLTVAAKVEPPAPPIAP